MLRAWLCECAATLFDCEMCQPCSWRKQFKKSWYDYLRVDRKKQMKVITPLPPALQRLKVVANLMDSKFKIPGTNIRFGLDALIGLVPGAGDLTGFGISGYMMWVMANNGASSFVLARMMLNVLIDTLFGSIPILGDLFDIAFKSNMKNMRLMEQHYEEGRHNGSAWKVIIPILLLLFLFVVGIVVLVYWFISWLWEMGQGW